MPGGTGVSTNITTQPDTNRPLGSTGGPWVSNGKKPPASRLRGGGRRRSVPHLLLGALLVLVCAAVSVVMSLNSGNREPVLALAQSVSVGQVLTAQDLKQVNVAADPSVSVVDASQVASVVGKTMSTSLSAGSLLTSDAVGTGGVPAVGQALAALSLKSGQFPPEVAAGSHVSVVFVPGQAGAAASPPTPDQSTVWPAVVTSVTSPPNQQITVISVELGESAALQVAAVPAGQLSVVMVSEGGGR
jgi:SAF domain-containing protein